MWELYVLPLLTYYNATLRLCNISSLFLFQRHWTNKRGKTKVFTPTENSHLINHEINKSPEDKNEDLIEKVTATLKKVKEEDKKERLTLLGLTWVRMTAV